MTTKNTALNNLADEVRELLDERRKLETEIARVHQIGNAAETEESSLIAAGDSLESDTKLGLLGRLGLRRALAPKRIGQLQSELAALDARLAPVVNNCAHQALLHLQSVELSRYRRFCEALAPFFGNGLENQFFQKHPHVPMRGIRAKSWFLETDALMSLHAPRMNVPHPQHSRTNQPHEKAEQLLKLIPALPDDDSADGEQGGRLEKAVGALAAMFT